MKKIYAFTMITIYGLVLFVAILMMYITSSQAYFSALTIFNSIMIIQFPILLQCSREYVRN